MLKLVVMRITVVLMVDGVIGLNGVTAAKHVDEVLSVELETVPTQSPRMEEPIVMERKLALSFVKLKDVLVSFNDFMFIEGSTVY